MELLALLVAAAKCEEEGQELCDFEYDLDTCTGSFKCCGGGGGGPGPGPGIPPIIIIVIDPYPWDTDDDGPGSEDGWDAENP